MRYNIVSTGSKGNAVVIEDRLLIDCGVPFARLKPYYRGLQLVLLTHIHGDHFNERTISKLADERPTLRFGCCDWLVEKLVLCGVSKGNIDVYGFGHYFTYRIYSLEQASDCSALMARDMTVEPFPLYHNVPNCGYKVHFSHGKLLYATDTCKIDTDAPDYDIYMLETNYGNDEIQERISDKESRGEQYIYEYDVLENHLSERAAFEFYMKNAGQKSKLVRLHMHEQKEQDAIGE
jgi:mRNA degradation ribonuclease J1/J2